MMGTRNFSDDFKRDAVAQITERGYPVSDVSKRLGWAHIPSMPGRRSSQYLSIRATLIRLRRSAGCSRNWPVLPRSATF